MKTSRKGTRARRGDKRSAKGAMADLGRLQTVSCATKTSPRRPSRAATGFEARSRLLFRPSHNRRGGNEVSVVSHSKTEQYFDNPWIRSFQPALDLVTDLLVVPGARQQGHGDKHAAWAKMQGCKVGDPI